jgi:hypothetical protein
MPIQLIIRNPLDRDAREFIQRAGVTDAGGRSQINEFVRGIKGLGLWDSMVCWPLRSTQNAGTGTTAYSLGGLGTFNGTLVNGPTWGSNGVIFDGINQHIDLNIKPSTTLNINANEVGAVGLTAPTLAGYRVLIGRETLAGGTGATSVGRSGATVFYQNNENGSPSTTLTMDGLMFTGATSSTQSRLIKNGQSIAVAVPTTKNATTNNLLLAAGGSVTPAFFADITSSLSVVVNQSMSLEQHLAFYTLYKQTLGIGLGLP